ncbi:hypothetical protein OEZ86_007271 [Tetradesmus obliquus]|nr:hypothetical protein OEZ86_007271 [Tetradesmus obliquus]
MQLVKDVVGNISQVSDSSLFGASQFSITGSPIAGLENLSSDVPYVLDKLRANTFGNGTTNTDGGIRQCYEKLPGGGSTGILTRGYTNPSLPRMIMLLTDGLPNRRDFDSVPNNATCPCFISPGAAENNCRSCAREVATKRANDASTDGVTFVSVGVGQVDAAWLSSIGQFYYIDNFDLLQTLVGAITAAACADIDVSVNCSRGQTAAIGGVVSNQLEITNGGIFNYTSPLPFSVTLDAAGLQGLVVQPSAGSPPGVQG